MHKAQIIVRSFLLIVMLMAVSSVVFYSIESGRVHDVMQQESFTSQQVSSQQLLLRQIIHSEHGRNSHIKMQTVPKNPDEPGLLREFQSFAVKFHVSLQSVQFSLSNMSQSMQTTQAASQVSAVLVLQGSSGALLRFIHAMQSARRLTGVTTATLTIAGAYSSTLSVNLVFPYGS